MSKLLTAEVRELWPENEPVVVEFNEQGDAVLHRHGRRFTIPSDQIDQVVARLNDRR